jgi:sigma-B regulation protein RsbU (phosphoserine phosphatase)
LLDRTVSELQERERIMSEELQLAQEVQREWLPKVFPFSDELQFAALCRTSLAVGGDLYDAFRVDDRTAGFYIADVSGHGVSAALLTATLKVSFDRFRDILPIDSTSALSGNDGRSLTFGSAESMARFLETLNNALVESIPLFSFVTFQLGVIQLDTGRLHLANAGHHSPLCYRESSRQVEALPVSSNLPLGAAPNWRFQIQEFQLHPGDRLIVHTDGITECQNERFEEFGQEHLMETIRLHHQDDPETLLREILQRTSQFSGQTAPADDQAVLVIDFHALNRPAVPGPV